MFKNYFKIAWRNILKNRFYSLVNIVGLSVGIAFTLIIGAYVWSELQVNRQLKNADRQYILQSKWKDPNEGYEIATLGPLAKALKENYPNLVASYYRFDGITSNVSKDNKSFREGIQMGDSTLLNMYGFTLLQGNAATALSEPFTAVITTDKAIKYFGKTDITGQTITIENFSGLKHDFLITGVLNKLPENSVTCLAKNYPNEIFISDANLNFFKRDMSWQNPFICGYVELRKGITPKDLEEPIAHLLKQNAPPLFIADLKPYLVPLKDYYLSADNGVVKKMLYALSAIVLFILAMAVINFINMSVSRSTVRMKEIGIRKVLGGLKKQLIIQFLVESFIIVLFAIMFAFVIYGLTKNLFSNILDKEIPSLINFPLYFVVFPLMLLFIISFIAGIYPAFVLSSLKSVESLKGKSSFATKNVWLRKSLIAFQFGTAIIAFVGTIIISKQVNLFLSKDLGYNKEYVISAQVPRDWTPKGVDKMMTIRDQFTSMPGVKSVTLSYEIPDGNNAGQAYIYKRGMNTTQAIPMQVLQADENYLSVYQIPLKAGSFFDGNKLDSGRVIMNETAIHALGWKNAADAVGQQINWTGDQTVFTIKGVTNDFLFGSMQRKVAPIIFANVQFSTSYRFFSFKLSPGNIASTISALQMKWSVLMQGAPFEYRFMDETLANLYKSEIQLKKASYTSAVLAIIIVLLGVSGLISLSIQKRVKEIGIRKVFGSSVAGILSLFMKEFLQIILIAGLVACPLAYLIMNNWLQGYAYRIRITAMPFIASVILLGFITCILIIFQTMNAANTNPVKSLRTE